MTMEIEIAKTIIQQMGGAGRMTAMVGAKQFMALSSGVQFRIGGGAYRKINRVQVTLNGSDLYDVAFFRTTKCAVLSVKEVKDVYAEDLKPVFERETGMYLSL